VTFVAVIAGAFLLARTTPLGGLLSEETVRAASASIRGFWWAPIALVALYVVIAPMGLPVAPLIVGGAAFGATEGTIYNSAGLMLGAAVSYGFARTLGRDFVVRITGRRTRKAERLLSRHGFWPLVQTRFAPLPFPVVNFGAALAGVRTSRFLLATVLGIVPSTVVHTFFIARLLQADAESRAPLLIAYALSFAALNLVLGGIWLRQRLARRRRLALLRKRRASAGTRTRTRKAPAS
jgi:uncharacterized membrane protein YdjX (TVP38/TMEM64 family)